MNVFVDKMSAMLRFWWALVLFGLLFIGIGISVSLHVFETYYSLNTFFMVAMITIGMLELYFSWSNKALIDNWEWYFINGCIDLGIGLLLLIIPAAGMGLFHFIMPFWLIFRGISLFCIVYTTENNPVPNRYWVLGMAVIGIICGITIIWEPNVIKLPHNLMEGIAFITMGLMRITLGMHMRRFTLAHEAKMEQKCCISDSV